MITAEQFEEWERDAAKNICGDGLKCDDHNECEWLGRILALVADVRSLRERTGRYAEDLGRLHVRFMALDVENAGLWNAARVPGLAFAIEEVEAVRRVKVAAYGEALRPAFLAAFDDILVTLRADLERGGGAGCGRGTDMKLRRVRERPSYGDATARSAIATILIDEYLEGLGGEYRGFIWGWAERRLKRRIAAELARATRAPKSRIRRST